VADTNTTVSTLERWAVYTSSITTQAKITGLDVDVTLDEVRAKVTGADVDVTLTGSAGPVRLQIDRDLAEPAVLQKTVVKLRREGQP
jgi:DNA-binding protein YbaB